MKTWAKLMAVSLLFGLAVAETTPTCDLDQPGLSKRRSHILAMDRFDPCIKATFNEETATRLKEAKTLEDFRGVIRDLCPKLAEMVTCMAGARATLQSCHNKNVTVRPMLFSEMMENILPGGCEHDGERLAYIAHGYSFLNKGQTLVPLRRCLFKVITLLKVPNRADVDLASEMYTTYNTLRTLRNCMQYVEDDAYKPALEWLLTEGLHHFKCQDPEQDMLVSCEEIDVTKVPVPNLCDMKPLNTSHLYDDLEEGIKECDAYLINHDEREGTVQTSIEGLKEQYKKACANRYLPSCQVDMSAYAEACLPPTEYRQFQLFMRSVEDIRERICVDEGARMATLMHQIYQQIEIEEHRHPNPIRDCRKQVLEARKTQHHEDHAVSTKNMRSYHEMTAFKGCIVEQLHPDNEIAKDLENMIIDVLRKMKCVKPEDETEVLCASIHEH